MTAPHPLFLIWHILERTRYKTPYTLLWELLNSLVMLILLIRTPIYHSMLGKAVFY